MSKLNLLSIKTCLSSNSYLSSKYELKEVSKNYSDTVAQFILAKISSIKLLEFQGFIFSFKG